MERVVLDELFEGDDVHVVHQDLDALVQFAVGCGAYCLNIADDLCVLNLREDLEFISQFQLLGKCDLFLILVVQSFHLVLLRPFLLLVGLL